MSLNKYIIHEVHDDGICFINLNRNSINTINISYIDELYNVIDSIRNNKSVRILIIRSTQKHFCAGADLKERDNMSAKETIEFLKKLNTCFDLLESLDIPTIASMHGAALGGGFELSLCCDFRIASESSILGLPETSIGIIPGAGGTYRLSRLIGISKAKYWIFSAQKFNADYALQDGAIDFITDDDELLDTTLEISQSILNNAPIAVKAAKRSINRNYLKTKDHSKNELNEYTSIINTQDRKEALKAFSEKRKPRWKNK